LLTAFPLSEIERVVRRTAITAIIIGAVMAVVAWLLGQPQFVPGIGIGLVLAIANHRVFQSSAMRFTSTEGVINRKPFAGSVALRLGLCTAVAIGMLIIDQPAGWGVMAGLALFQATMLGSAVVALFRYQRQGFVEEEGGE
jgi:drug/metabolite transporter (DMT)-like permease